MRWHHALVVTALLIAACGGGGAVSDTTTTTTTPVAVPTTAGSATETTTTSTAPSTVVDERVVRVSVVLAAGAMTVTVDGEPAPRRVMVRLGDEVSIDFISDVAEELHVHGYEVLVTVTPGQPGSATFVADIPGIFEVEQHLAGHTTVFSIQVQ